MNVHFMCWLKCLFSGLLAIHVGVELLGHMVNLCLIMFNLSLLSSVTCANRYRNSVSGG